MANAIAAVSDGNKKKLESSEQLGNTVVHAGRNGVAAGTALNSNSFIGSIPPSIGYLSKLSWLDLSDNKLSGSIPVSSGTAPGLDMLVNARHLNLSNNDLTGSLPNLTGMNFLSYVMLGHNHLNGTLDLGNSYRSNLMLDLRNNSITTFRQDIGYRNKSSNSGVIVGATVGSSVLVLLLLCAGLYAFHQKRKAERVIKDNSPFASWDPDKGNGGIPQLKGARCFSFEELQKCTNNFSEDNSIGSGGYGKVYKGALATGQLVAIKRAQQGSLQGAIEFKAEIELLSRIHHKNVVSLAGFCYGQGEQILVYEYISNGTLKENLSVSPTKICPGKENIFSCDWENYKPSTYRNLQMIYAGKTGIRLDWGKRLRVALDSARGLAYLHELANPPIIHRDIKSNNILLDDHLNAKVADFGLSKPVSDVAKGHISTQVKGTMGYMDPEYYMTEQLTKKSDVYSFGVVLLELLTSRVPIQQGRYIVREVMEAMRNSGDPYNLNEVLDPVLRSGPKLQGLDKFVNLAMNCVKESGADRPAMDEVVRVIESITQLNLHNGSASTSPSQDEMFRNDFYEPHETVESDLYHHVIGFSNKAEKYHSFLSIPRSSFIPAFHLSFLKPTRYSIGT
ncbi:hypothetical protein RJ639_035234 [Escallonia herrerae]|uniref:non-specific serine/threonine protein kinase n=1 Tax=Escallonia herrerae TaxID=1293975 RepID=A0AA88WUN1_9ASTE|nr:hypothetical protein RJ639_035234 [Escallonia herrerae]